MNQIPSSNTNAIRALAMQNQSAFVATMLPKVTANSTAVRPGPSTITRVLRHRVTGLYFSDGHWTKDPFQATDFTDSLQAAEACARYGLTQVDLSIHLAKCRQGFFNTPLR